MKIVLPGISTVFSTEIEKVNTIVIENQSLFSKICLDIYNQAMLGMEGLTVVSVDNIPVDMSKCVELISQFIPFELNKKGLLNKLVSRMEKVAVDPDYYEQTMIEMADIEKYIWSIQENMPGNIALTKLTFGNILKSIGLEFEDVYDSLGEKLIDYMELVREYDRDKLFILVNLRSYVPEGEMLEFLDTVLRKNLNVLLIDNYGYKVLQYEKRCIVDSDCCEIN